MAKDNRNKTMVFLIISIFIMLGITVFTALSKEKIGFVVNQEIFEQFNGKAEMETKFSALRGQNQSVLDSLMLGINTVSNTAEREALLNNFLKKQQEFAARENQLSQQYTDQIWSRINEYLTKYGKDEGYTYLLGASGNGSLMYANNKKNITGEVVEYINNKYEGHED